MKRVLFYRWLSFLLMFLLQTISLNAQSGQRSLSGQVVDSHNEPLPGANVYLKGDIHNGTSTDAEGYFLLKIPAGQNKVVIEASFTKTFQTWPRGWFHIL